jgi:2',3'-cyclic-nucleotide 2'-phosphodiesterase (5'-nucleotidase family)
MHLRNSLLALAALSVICTACNSNPSVSPDAGGIADTGTHAGLDAATATPADAAAPAPDATVLVTDAAVLVPDVGPLALPDASEPPDAQVAIPPDAATLPPDAAALPPDAAALPPDAAVAPDLHVTVLQTTDIHDHADGFGYLKDKATPGPTGSYARIAAYVNAVRAAADAAHPVVLVDSGDWTMGTLYDLSLGKQPLARMLQKTLQFDCVTLGNHEFDYGTAGLATILNASATSGYDTPIVASNMALNGDTYLAPFVGSGLAIQPTFVETLPNGLKVGYIGLMGVNAAADAPEAPPVTFTDYSQDYSTLQTMVDDLRTAQGCDVVIALSHAGTDLSGLTGEDISLAQNVTGIDVIASGHTHNPFDTNHPVKNGTWTTQVVCAGAYGSNVFRVDLTYHPGSHSTTLDAADNMPMTDADLAWIPGGVTLDPTLKMVVGLADSALNKGLGPVFTQLMKFPDYVSTDPNTGVYHLIGSTAQDMDSNDRDPVPAPNGMGDLCADAVRNVPNGILSSVVAKLIAAGWNGSLTDPNLPAILAAANLAGYDLTPYTASVVATGVIRDPMPAGPITFAEGYDVLPLGITPDSTQALPVGFPLMSVYLTLTDLKTVCALQLLAQTTLAPADDYLNLSGLGYSLNTAGAYDFFKYATAAAVLQLTLAKEQAGSLDALQALADMAKMGTDGGTALLGDAGKGNAYAIAMVDLNDVSPTGPQVAANLTAVGAVAAAGQQGQMQAYALIMSKAIAAIDTVSSFDPADPECEGTTTALSGTTRYRLAADLYAVLMMNQIDAYFGVSITAYAGPTGPAVVSGGDLTAAMANRINMTPGAATFQETKEWMALMLYMITPKSQGGAFTNGAIGADYASTSTFSQFPTFGLAVTARNASYPLADIGQMMTTLVTLEAAP